MMRALLALLILATATADFTGTYSTEKQGAKITLVIRQANNDLTGTASLGDVKLALSGKADGKKASGKLRGTIEGTEFVLHFQGELIDQKLRMRVADEEEGRALWSEAEEYLFDRVGDGPKAEIPPKDDAKGLGRFLKQPTAVLKGGKEYVHASGGKFRYPSEWRLEELEGALKLTPPDAGADEIYAVVAESAEGATDPASADVVAYVDSQVRQLFPFVKRVGPVEKANAGNGKGAVVTWEGSHQGKEFRVRGYLTILKTYGVALLAAGPKAKVEGRDKALREIFHTFGWGQGKLDPNLVGVWSHWSYKGSGSYGRETKAKATLAQDGTFSYESDTETSMSAKGTNSVGDVVWTGGMASRRGNGWRGTWTADGTTLILNFEDGSTETFTYRFKRESSGNTFLVVKEEGGKETEWSRAG